MQTINKKARLLMTTCACAAMIACVPVKQDVKEELPKLIKGPEEAPTRTITNFSQALRCMDDLREANVDILTFGQYLQPTAHHYPIDRFWSGESVPFLAYAVGQPANDAGLWRLADIANHAAAPQRGQRAVRGDGRQRVVAGRPQRAFAEV